VVSTSAIRIGAEGILLAVFAVVAFISVQAINNPTYWFPAFIAVSGTLAAGYNLVADLLRLRAGHSLTEGEITDIGASVSDTHDEPGTAGTAQSGTTENVSGRVLVMAVWLVALPVLALAIPFFFASLIWLVALLRFHARKNWLFVVLSVAVFGVVLNLLILLLEIRMPPAILTGLG
jgi:hypothetical protein